MNKINIGLYDNEKYEYPILTIYKKDFEKFKNILNKYQEQDEYNFDDFIKILRINNIFVIETYKEEEIFF